jgi:hypothetical protein
MQDALRAPPADDDGEAEDDEDRRCTEGRATLSSIVALAIEACQQPKLVHGALADVIYSKFWENSGVLDDSDDDVD